jgi:hypothetical protein
MGMVRTELFLENRQHAAHQRLKLLR